MSGNSARFISSRDSLSGDGVGALEVGRDSGASSLKEESVSPTNAVLVGASGIAPFHKSLVVRTTTTFKKVTTR